MANSEREDKVGLAVIISQAVVTTIVLLGYSFLYLEMYFPQGFLFCVLVYDVLAIISHMLFRKWERGKAGNSRKKNKNGERKNTSTRNIIIFHSMVSALAIFFAFLFIYKEITVMIYSIVTVLWLASFSSGIRLYIKK
jgi:hypothetical protein